MIMKQMGFSSDDRDLDDYESVCLDDVWCEVRSVTGVAGGGDGRPAGPLRRVRLAHGRGRQGGTTSKRKSVYPRVILRHAGALATALLYEPDGKGVTMITGAPRRVVLPVAIRHGLSLAAVSPVDRDKHPILWEEGPAARPRSSVRTRKSGRNVLTQPPYPSRWPAAAAGAARAGRLPSRTPARSACHHAPEQWPGRWAGRDRCRLGGGCARCRSW